MIKSNSISQIEIDKLIQNGDKIIIIDVRNPEEYSEKHIPTAVNIPLEQIESGKVEFEKNTVVVTACGKGGGRSEKAANFIQNQFENEVYFLEGGTFGWKEKE